MKLENNFPSEDFCKQTSCEHNKKVLELRMHADLRITDKKIALKEIYNIRKDYCEKCQATQYHRYLIKSHSS